MRTPFLVTVLFASACMPELPVCDEASALTVAYLDTGVAASDENGVPMYAGQAILHASCSSAGRCHAQSAVGRGRYGAPLGLDFDLAPRCIDGSCDPNTTRFASARESVLAHARLMHAAIERGSMPPGDIGRALLEEGPRFYTLDVDGLDAVREGASLADAGERLPSIDDPRGREIVANYLACGAPVVELTATPQGSDPGAPCAYAGDVGDCVLRLLVPIEPPEPTFDSIYAQYLRPACASCHGEGPGDRRAESALDFTTADGTYAALLAPSAGEACGGSGLRVIPGDASASLLVDKLAADPSCGEPMAGARGAPREVIEAIRTWIDQGASR